MTKLSAIVKEQILLETEVMDISDKEYDVDDNGLELVKEQLDKLNNKAAKYKVAPIKLKILKERWEYVLNDQARILHRRGSLIPYPNVADPKSREKYFRPLKVYTIKLEGDAPHIEGFQFIARLEHTSEGNFIYMNPDIDEAQLPQEFKNANQRCDICHTNRDRNDTFVIRMERDDPERFPNHKKGDYLIVGRNCLQRFLPQMEVTSMIWFTRALSILDRLLNNASYSGGGSEYDDNESYEDRSYGRRGDYEFRNTLLRYIAATYLYEGKYISKKQANANSFEYGGNGQASTLQTAMREMYAGPKEKTPIIDRYKTDDNFQRNVDELMKEFEDWVPTKDWDAMGREKPEFDTFFNNLKLVSKEENIRRRHFGFFSALFQMFVRDKRIKEKAKQEKERQDGFEPSPVKFGNDLLKKRLSVIAKEAGLATKGWEVKVVKKTEYERQSYGYGGSSIGYRISFVDNYGNDFIWFASADIGFEEGKKYIIDGTVVGYEDRNKYSGRPQTRLNRVKIIKPL